MKKTAERSAVFDFVGNSIQRRGELRSPANYDGEWWVAEGCTVQYDYKQVVQDDCIQFCDIIKGKIMT